MAETSRRMRAAIAAMLLVACLMPVIDRANAEEKMLRFIPQADLRSIDPIWTTAYITRNFGYMVFDTLFALDKDLQPRPQMVDRWTVSDDKLSYSFTLRDGLKWHDGQPVRAADCVASIERWAKRDPFGQKMMEAGAVSAVAQSARQIVEQRAVHDAAAAGPDRCLPAGHRGDRLRAVQIRQGG